MPRVMFPSTTALAAIKEISSEVVWLKKQNQVVGIVLGLDFLC